MALKPRLALWAGVGFFYLGIGVLIASLISAKSAGFGEYRKTFDSKDLRFGSPLMGDMTANIGDVITRLK